jgi:hypothetical protein
MESLNVALSLFLGHLCARFFFLQIVGVSIEPRETLQEHLKS